MEIGNFFAQLNPGDVGFAGLLSLAVFLILTGKLVPKSTVDEIRRDRDVALAASAEEKAEWREVALTEQATTRELNGQLGSLLEYARTTEHVLRSIQGHDREAT